MSMALLPSIRIISKICLLTATLADKDNPLCDLLMGGEFVSDGSYSACACSVSKSHSQNANIK